MIGCALTLFQAGSEKDRVRNRWEAVICFVAEKRTAGFLGEFPPECRKIVQITGAARLVLADYFRTFSGLCVNISKGEWFQQNPQ